MKTGIVILVIILILAFVLGSAFVSPAQPDGDQTRSGECGLVAGGCGAATARRFDSQFGGDG